MIEPELIYSFVGGIGAKARNVPLFDPTDIATDTNEVRLLSDAALLHEIAKPCSLARPRTVNQRTPCPAAASRMGKLADHSEILPEPDFRRSAHSRPQKCLRHHTGLDRNCLSDSARATFPRWSPACASRPSEICASSGTWITTRRGDAWTRIMSLPAIAGANDGGDWPFPSECGR